MSNDKITKTRAQHESPGGMLPMEALSHSLAENERLRAENARLRAQVAEYFSERDTHPVEREE